MRKINKNINITLIFMLIGVFLSTGFACADDVLRVPMGIGDRARTAVGKDAQNLVTRLESVCQNMIDSGRILMDPAKFQHRTVKIGEQSLLLIYRPPESIPIEPTSLKKYDFSKLDIPVDETDSMLEEGRIPDSDYIERHINIPAGNGSKAYDLAGNFGPIVRNHSLFMNGKRNQILENGDLEAGFLTLEKLPGYLLIYGSIGARISENRFHMHAIPAPDDWALSHALKEVINQRNDVKVTKVHAAENTSYICFEGKEKTEVDREAMGLINELKHDNCPHGVVLNKTEDGIYQAYIMPLKWDNPVQPGFEALRLGIFHLAGILVFYNKDDFEKANAENLKPVFGRWVVPWDITQKYLQHSFEPAGVLAEKSAVGQSRLASNENLPLGNSRILIVQDDNIKASFQKDVLIKKGAKEENIIIVSDWGSVVSTLQEHEFNFDAIILDMGFPIVKLSPKMVIIEGVKDGKWSGISVIERLIANKTIPVVIYSNKVTYWEDVLEHIDRTVHPKLFELTRQKRDMPDFITIQKSGYLMMEDMSKAVSVIEEMIKRNAIKLEGKATGTSPADASL